MRREHLDDRDRKQQYGRVHRLFLVVRDDHAARHEAEQPGHQHLIVRRLIHSAIPVGVDRFIFQDGVVRPTRRNPIDRPLPA